MEDHITETALTAVVDVRQAGYRLGLVARLRDDEQTPCFFCHQQASVRQEGHCPGFFEARNRCRVEGIHCGCLATAKQQDRYEGECFHLVVPCGG